MKNNRFLTDRELLQIYGINHPKENLGNEFNQRVALGKMKYSSSNSGHVINNKYIRWGLAIGIIAIVSVLAVKLFDVAETNYAFQNLLP